MWLQNRREATVERSRTASAVRRDDPGEFRVGRLKHERVKVPRGESLMEWAENVMQIHSDRKSVLEVALLALYFQKACFGMQWGGVRASVRSLLLENFLTEFKKKLQFCDYPGGVSWRRGDWAGTHP